MHLWVVGAGGLFGSSLVRRAHADGFRVFASVHVPWSDAEAARIHLQADATSFFKKVDSREEPWGIAWAAGRVTTASSSEEAARELALYRNFISDLSPLVRQRDDAGYGSFLFTSSAGGVYAGSASPPFSTSTAVKPISPYGDLKVAQEQVTLEHLGGACAVTIARIANLYGPGQDLRKLQGLVSRLTLCAAKHEPITMFVPLDTLRDYIYVDDAAASALHWLQMPSNPVNTRVIASGTATSLGYIISLVQDITHVRFPVAYGIHASAAAQAPDMRLIPDEDHVIASMPRTQLPDGIKRVHLDILERLQRGAATAV